MANKWEALRNNVWRTRWDRLFPARPLGWWRREREGMITPLHRFNNDMVFVDGELLQSAGWEGAVDARSFYIDYETGYVYIGADPSNRLVEITAFDCALLRTTRPAHGKAPDRKGFVIRGVTFTQYAYRALDIEGKKPAASVSEEPTDDPVGPADPSTFGKEVVGTTLEHVTISYSSRVAGYFRGDGLTIRHSLISDTSTEGIYVIGSSDVLLEKNIIRRNNIEQLTGYYPAAVKIFNQSHRVTVRDNLVIDQRHSNGVWYDVGNCGRRVRQQLDRGSDRRLLLRDLQGSDRRRQRVRGLREGHPRAEQLERPRLPQHASERAGLVRAQRAQRGRRSLRLASAHRARRGPA